MQGQHTWTEIPSSLYAAAVVAAAALMRCT
jgi:hypothetical protein